jgi:hypothetical protein
MYEVTITNLTPGHSQSHHRCWSPIRRMQDFLQ